MSIDPIASRLASQGVAHAPEIAGAARRHGLDADLLAAVAAQETGGPGSNAGRNVVGDGGHGRGLFQIDDRWHSFAKSPAAMDPGDNADYAAGMISGLLAQYKGNVHRALSAYNAGDPDAKGTQTQWGDGKRLGYADSVMQHYARLTGGPPVPMPRSHRRGPFGGRDPEGRSHVERARVGGRRNEFAPRDARGARIAGSRIPISADSGAALATAPKLPAASDGLRRLTRRRRR